MTTELTVSKLYHPGPIVESLVKNDNFITLANLFSQKYVKKKKD